MVKIKQESIVGIAEAILPMHGAYLVDVHIRGERGESVIQVLADTDAGISIALCAQISREIANRIEELQLIESRYRLEVSSPGLEKPLKVFRQYVTNTGRKVRIRSATPDGEQVDEGILRGIDGASVLLELADGSTVAIGTDRIRECRHLLPW